MRIGIIQFPGSNCERETKMAVKRAEMEPVDFLWNEPLDKLRSFDGYIIVGGFSYEDRSRAGIIAALDPVIQELKTQSEQGKPILGICNGAQILVEGGLVPGLENHKLGLALTENKRTIDHKIIGTGYYNTWVNIRLSDEYQRNAFTKYLSRKDILSMPIAHAEGRFYMTDTLLQEIEAQGLNVFQYCDASGMIVSQFPINPNGSMNNIAAIANKNGNVLAIMPHPERTKSGDAIFQSMRDYIAAQHHERHETLYYYPRRPVISDYKKPNNAYECVIELMITDNHAVTVQKTLHEHEIPVTVKRKVHWEIHCDSQQTVDQIKLSNVLFNSQKEFESPIHHMDTIKKINYLVRAKDDLHGLKKRHILQTHFGLHTTAIYQSVIWEFAAETDIQSLIEPILSTNIIFNLYAYDCHRYHCTQF